MRFMIYIFAILTIGTSFNPIPFAHAEGSASDQLMQIASKNKDEIGFFRELENRYRERFETSTSNTAALMGLCQRLSQMSVFSLPHLAIRSLGEACDTHQAEAIRTQFLKFGQQDLIEEFMVSLRAQVQNSGTVNAFSRNIAKNVRGKESPLLAFGLFALFAL